MEYNNSNDIQTALLFQVLLILLEEVSLKMMMILFCDLNSVSGPGVVVGR